MVKGLKKNSGLIFDRKLSCRAQINQIYVLKRLLILVVVWRQIDTGQEQGQKDQEGDAGGLIKLSEPGEREREEYMAECKKSKKGLVGKQWRAEKADSQIPG